MEVLLVIAGILVAVAIYRYTEKQAAIKKRKAEELAAVVNTNFLYLDAPFVTVKGMLAAIERGEAPPAILAGAIDEIEQSILGSEGHLYLGQRRPNLARGIEIETEYEAIAQGVKRESEYRLFQKIKPYVEAQLSIWHAGADLPFPVLQTQDIRDRHTYIIGKSGSGKTTLLTWMVYQDMAKHEGVAFLSPEAETIEEEIIPYIPPYRLDDVIYFNPADSSNRYSFNPLHLDEDEDLDQKVDEVYANFSRLMEGDMSPRISQILRQLFYALVELPGATLLDIPRLLDRENPHYRSQVIAELRDEQTKAFWRDTYPTLPVNAHVPIISRLAPFIRPRRVRNILCRPEKGLDFREIMDSGKILLCNLSDGLLGEHASRLLGGFIMSQIQLATVSRADTPQRERRRFYVYLDEFQSFTAHSNVSYDKLLSRARKYRLPLILAHQQMGQLPPNLLKEVFGNVSTIVSFLVSRADAGVVAREFVRDDAPDKKTVAPEELVTLDVGEAFIKIGTLAFSLGVTSTLRDIEAHRDNRRAVLEASRRPGREPGADEEAMPGGRTREKERPSEEIPPDPFSSDFDPQDVF